MDLIWIPLFFFPLDSWGKLNIVVNDFKELLLLCVINAHDYVKNFVFAKCMLNYLWVKYVMFVLTLSSKKKKKVESEGKE